MRDNMKVSSGIKALLITIGIMLFMPLTFHALTKLWAYDKVLTWRILTVGSVLIIGAFVFVAILLVIQEWEEKK